VYKLSNADQQQAFKPMEKLIEFCELERKHSVKQQ
jgi:hypothetical protein